ncbi:MAG: hypothetical protein JO039_09195 [Solirubrobacterales bacterium]|nr:hypothetical protein [Solirubrobacterales bacterium]
MARNNSRSAPRPWMVIVRRPGMPPAGRAAGSGAGGAGARGGRRADGAAGSGAGAGVRGGRRADVADEADERDPAGRTPVWADLRRVRGASTAKASSHAWSLHAAPSAAEPRARAM